MKRITRHATGVLTAVLVLLAGPALAAMDHADAPNKMVIQVSSDDPLTQKIALHNAVNLQKSLGMDNVAIEVVAYGPGLSLLTQGGDQSERVKSLALQDITFSACGNTMAKMEEKSGKKPQLVEGVQVVPAGVRRIMDLQQQGYTYLRP